MANEVQAQPERILLISLAGIGDTLMATPLLHELRLNFPQTTLDVLVMWPGSRDVLAGNPHVNQVIQHNFLRGLPITNLKVLLALRRRGYQVSINTFPQSKVEYRLTAWLVHAPLRISHQYDNWRRVDHWLVNRTVPQRYDLHAVENNLNLLSLLQARPLAESHYPELYLTPAEHEQAQAFLEAHALTDKRLLGIHVGSGKTKNLALRRWPLDYFAELIQRVVSAHRRVGVLLFGGPEEQADHQVVLNRTRHPWVQVAQMRNLRETAALIGRCHVFLSVDTALMHLAAAMQVPRQLVIETPTFNKTVEPYGRPYVLIPNPMVKGRNLDYYRYDGRGIQGNPQHLRACMKSVTVHKVFAEVMAALDRV